MKISTNELAAIRQMRQTRDTLALRLGAMTYEYERNKIGILNEIESASRQEDQVAERALRTCGFDPAAETYTIDGETGEVKRLVDGQWKTAFLKA